MADYRVRKATELDLRDMYTMVRRMLAEAPEYRDRDPATTRIVMNLEKYVYEKTRCAFVATVGTFPIGLMLGYTYIPEMFDEVNAADTILFVENPWRKSGIGQQLLAAYADWAEEQGAGGRIYFGTTSGIRTNDTVKAGEASGFKAIGAIMRKA